MAGDGRRDQESAQRRRPVESSARMTVQRFGLSRPQPDKFHETTEPATHSPRSVGGADGTSGGSASPGRGIRDLRHIPKPAWRRVLNQRPACATWNVRPPILSEFPTLWLTCVPGHVSRPALPTLFMGAIELSCLGLRMFSIQPRVDSGRGQDRTLKTCLRSLK